MNGGALSDNSSFMQLTDFESDAWLYPTRTVRVRVLPDMKFFELLREFTAPAAAETEIARIIALETIIKISEV